METTIDFITALLVEDIESYLKNYGNYGYLLNKSMNYEIEEIQMRVYIHKIKTDNIYYYNLCATNFWHDENKRINVVLFESNSFDTVLELLENLKDVKMNYTFYDNKLCSPEQKEKLRKLKKSLSFFPKKEKECSICYEPTKQVTICNHPVCLHCREKCILSQKKNCPICRSTKLDMYPRPDLLFTL